jgi:hypothetical protein
MKKEEAIAVKSRELKRLKVLEQVIEGRMKQKRMLIRKALVIPCDAC